MQLFISADRNNDYFVNTIKEYCDNSNQRHSWIFLPDTPCIPGETLSRRIIRNISSADLIFIDVTPSEYHREIDGQSETKWFTNAGVVIEYSAAVALGRIEDMKVYCLTSPDLLHQVLRERITERYPQGDKPAFTQHVNGIVTQRETDINQLLRQSRIAVSLRSIYPEI